jgi:glucose/arabinose dehydrogenase
MPSGPRRRHTALPPAARLGALLVLSVVALVSACAEPVGSPTTGGGTGTDASASASRPSTSPTGAAPSDSTDAPSQPASGPTGEPPALQLDVVVGGLDAPVDVAVRPGEPEALYVVEQGGRVVVVRDGAVRDEPFLDIADQVTAGGEQGLLGLAFHPDPADERLFVYYTATDGNQVLASFRAPSGSDSVADRASERRLLDMDDPFGNHNGGALAFGPDGFLYIGTGDGGGGGDPLGSGRDLSSLLAKVLRIDIDGTSAEQPYAIPPDNPYVGTADARPETWLSGLRNPWRIRFDRDTGDLWIGDVGQGEREEVDVARTGQAGLDFGWNVTEGTQCYEPAEGCSTDGLTPPVTEYSHEQGCSVTGGTVYRGTGSPTLAGFYVFSDYCSGLFWAIPATAEPTIEPVVVAESGRSISAIAEDGAGELVATDLATGELLRISAPGT